MPPGAGRKRMPWWVAVLVLLLLLARQYSQSQRTEPPHRNPDGRSSVNIEPPDFSPAGPPASGGPVVAPTPAPQPQAGTPDRSWVGAQPGEYRVRRVVDGDTLLLDNDDRVRLLGVDTPESVKPDTPVQPWGKEASDFTRQFIAATGNRIRLEFDQERTDDYGRLLAYVWVGDRMLNEELLRAGLGRALLRHPYAQERKDRFKAAQRAAQQQQLGIWSSP